MRAMTDDRELREALTMLEGWLRANPPPPAARNDPTAVLHARHLQLMQREAERLRTELKKLDC